MKYYNRLTQSPKELTEKRIQALVSKKRNELLIQKLLKKTRIMELEADLEDLLLSDYDLKKRMELTESIQTLKEEREMLSTILKEEF